LGPSRTFASQAQIVFRHWKKLKNKKLQFEYYILGKLKKKQFYKELQII